MKEIGGYFQLDQLINKPYHENIIALNTGRNALFYIIMAKKIEKIYLPYFLCDSVSKLLEKHSVKYEYYHIDTDFLPTLDKELKRYEYLYLVNYYGQMNDSKIITFKEKYKNIIVDNTQSFFQKPIKGIDTIYSCRKYFGLSDGAYLATDVLLVYDIDVDKSSNRMRHILGRYEGQASRYYDDFKINDESFSNLPLKIMSKLTRNILGAIDYEKVINTRNSNFRYLSDKLTRSNPIQIIMPEGPFCYPYYIENGIEIRRRMSLNKIYIPTLWPNVIKDNDPSSIEYNYSANILPLPCDQRYSIEDMEKIVKELKNV